MPTLIASPTRITAAGNVPKLIDEYVGRVNSRTANGWELALEPSGKLVFRTAGLTVRVYGWACPEIS